MAVIKPWIKAARLRTLPLATSCVLIGAALAVSEDPSVAATSQFPLVVFGALTTVVLLQVLANFANDYGDFTKGTDLAANRQDRALTSGELSPDDMKKAMVVAAIAALLLGVGTLLAAFVPGVVLGVDDSSWEGAKMGALGAMGVAGIVAAFRYTVGKQSYGYKGFGDVYVMLFFGFVGVMGVGLLVAHHVVWPWTLPALFSGCMSVAVLNLNNLRDHESDGIAGKNTVVVRLGFRNGKVYHTALLLTGWTALGVFFFLHSDDGTWRGTMWYGLIALLHARHAVDVWRCQTPKLLDPELKRIALSTFLVALFMFMDQTLHP